MTNTDRTPPSPRRIVIALDSPRECARALELAAALAARTRTEMVALFVEDLNLVNAAGLEFVREVDPFSAVVRPFDESSLARVLRTHAEQVRRELEKIVDRARVKSSLQVVRGRYTEVAAAAAEIDVLVIANPAGSYGAGSTMRDTAAVRRLGGAVCVFYDGTEAARRALAFGADLAAERHLRMVVLVPEHSRASAVRDVEREAPGTRSEVIEIREPERFADLLEKSGCELLFAPSRRVPEKDTAGGEWPPRTRCPVVLVP